MNKYSFNPEKFGFEPITNFPELSFNYPMIDGYFVKIIEYDNFGDLVYWYKVISTLVGFGDNDDRIKITSSSYDFRKPSEFDKQSTPKTEFIGLISNDEFAESLLKHLMGTTKNSSLESDSIIRYERDLNTQMRKDYPQHYKVKL